MWHKADWDEVPKNPESIQFPREDWIMLHDAEKHAEEVFDEEFKLSKGKVNPTAVETDGTNDANGTNGTNGTNGH